MMLYEMTLWLIAMCMVMALAALHMPEQRRAAHGRQSFDEGHDGDEMPTRGV